MREVSVGITKLRDDVLYAALGATQRERGIGGLRSAADRKLAVAKLPKCFRPLANDPKVLATFPTSVRFPQQLAEWQIICVTRDECRQTPIKAELLHATDIARTVGGHGLLLALVRLRL